MSACGYGLAFGQITLHLRLQGQDRCLPAALYDGGRSTGNVASTEKGIVGEEALRLAGPRVRRITNWGSEGWQTWWTLLAYLAPGWPLVTALPQLADESEIPTTIPSAYTLPPTVALRAASERAQGTALYLGAFAWEISDFGPEDMDEPTMFRGGLESLYRGVIAEIFRRERRPLLPVQVPALLRAGTPLEIDGLLKEVVPLLGKGSLVLGSEDGTVAEAVAQALGERGHDVTVANLLDGLARLASVAGPWSEETEVG